MARNKRTERLFSLEDPKSIVSEAFRTLRTNIQYANIDKDIKAITVTSPSQREGKSTVSANLAFSLAESGKKTLIVDCDMRKPRLHKLFGVTNLDGLTRYLMGEIEGEEGFKKVKGVTGLDILTSGPVPPNPAELLGSNRMKDFLKGLEESYDYIILDSPPIGLVTDSAILSTISDGTILVLEVGQTQTEVAVHATELLQQVNAKILGVVLNKIPVRGNQYYNYKYYQYNQYYGEELDRRDRKKRRSR